LTAARSTRGGQTSRGGGGTHVGSCRAARRPASDRITWSRRLEELWAFAPAEFGGTYASFASRVHPDDLPAVNDAVARCMAAREPFAHEFRVVWPDGSVHWVIGRGEFAFDGAGRPLRMHGVVVETTARRQAAGTPRERRAASALHRARAGGARHVRP
jgi:hypothetical protein